MGHFSQGADVCSVDRGGKREGHGAIYKDAAHQTIRKRRNQGSTLGRY